MFFNGSGGGVKSRKGLLKKFPKNMLTTLLGSTFRIFRVAVGGTPELATVAENISPD
jgi:hypothetical protein